MAISSNAKLLVFNGGAGGQDQPNPTEFETDANLLASGYTNASFSSSTGLISIPAQAGVATIGFGSYIPENYTGPGAIYLYAVTIRDSLGNVLVQEEFNTWSGTLPGTSGERTAQFTGDGGRAWTVFTDASSIYTGYGEPFAPKTVGSDKGMVYPADGGGPFSVLMSTDLTLAAGVTSLTVDLRWGYQIQNWGTSARTFALGYQNQAVSTKDLFSFLSDVTAPTLGSATPADDATGVAVGADIVLSFSENVTAVAGKQIKIYKSSDNSLVTTIDATDSQVQVAGQTVTVNPASDLAVGTGYYVLIDNGAFADSVGNAYVGISSNTALNFTTVADATPPTLAITSSSSQFKAGQTATISFTFSEDVGASFTASDVTVAGGTLGAVSGTGTTRTATFTPAAGFEGAGSISVAAGTYTDLANNAGGAASLAGGLSIDTKAPSLAITSDKAALKAGEAAAITFTFSEDPGASFSAADIAVTGGTLGALAGSGAVRSATFTALTGPTAGTASISVAAGSYADAAGNDGGAGAMAPLPYDAAPPATVFSQFAFSADTGSSAVDFLTNSAQQTVTAKLSAPLAAGEVVLGSTDNGATWNNITSKVSGTTLTWTGVTLNGTGKLLLKVTSASGSAGPVSTQAYMLDTVAPGVSVGAMALSADTGTAGDFITNTAAQTISMNVEGLAAGEHLLGSVDGGKSWTALTGAISGGNLSWSGVQLGASDRILIAAVDAAGNATVSGSQAYRVDVQGPADLSLSSNVAVADPASTVVGTLSAVDRTVGDTLSYSLQGGADSALFAINGDRLVVADPAKLSAGTKTVVVRATDLAGNSVDKTLSLIAIKGGAAAGGDDKDNVPAIVEQAVAALPSSKGVVAGDGNGDGVPDAEQANVTSVPFLNSRAAQSNPTGAAPTFVTLVADSAAGKVDSAAGAVLHEVRQLDAAPGMPASIQTPLGQISFKAAVAQAGTAEHFSLYVDGTLPVNGYWKQDKAGNWVNLASAEYGGAVVREGGKLRLDFTITDGGQFDADGTANGMIVDPGTPGYRVANSADVDNDQFPDSLEPAHGLKTGVRDNDVFGSSKLFVMQLYRDILYREAEPAGVAFWQGQIDGGKLSRAQVGVQFLHSAEFESGAAGITRLYLGAMGRLPDDDGLTAWMDSQHSGMSLATIADLFAASTEFKGKYGSLDNAGYVSALYQNVLHRAAGQAELSYWTGQLGGGADRGDVLLALTGSAENLALTGHQITVALSYIGLLGRAPEPAGMDWWNGLLDKGMNEVELVGNFIGQPEYHGRFLA